MYITKKLLLTKQIELTVTHEQPPAGLVKQSPTEPAAPIITQQPNLLSEK